MTYQTLLFDIRDGIAVVTVNRPDKLNALNDQVMAELGDAVERIATTPDVRGALITGAGPKAFIAGADIGDLSRQGPFDGKARAMRGQAVLRRLETCGKPVIAAVNGYALGGGCELAMACHLRIASDTAGVGSPHLIEDRDHELVLGARIGLDDHHELVAPGGGPGLGDGAGEGPLGGQLQHLRRKRRNHALRRRCWARRHERCAVHRIEVAAHSAQRLGVVVAGHGHRLHQGDIILPG